MILITASIYCQLVPASQQQFLFQVASKLLWNSSS